MYNQQYQQPGTQQYQQPGTQQYQQPGTQQYQQPGTQQYQQPGTQQYQQQYQQPGAQQYSQPGTQHYQQTGGYANVPPNVQGQSTIAPHPPSMPSTPPPNISAAGWYTQQLGHPSPQELQKMWGWFSIIDKDKKGDIGAEELASMNFTGYMLSYPTAQRLVKVFHKDGSGRVGFAEYCFLHKFLVQCQESFARFDLDHNGSLDINESIQALQASGFNFDLILLNKVVTNYAQSGRIVTLDEYIEMNITLGLVRSSFEVRDTSRTGRITIGLEDYMQMVVEIV